MAEYEMPRMTLEERRKYLKRVWPRYIQSDRKGRGALLVEMEQVTRLGRDLIVVASAVRAYPAEFSGRVLVSFESLSMSGALRYVSKATSIIQPAISITKVAVFTQLKCYRRCYSSLK
jgi:hypothetical protein